jgi:hypothetical protein
MDGVGVASGGLVAVGSAVALGGLVAAGTDVASGGTAVELHAGTSSTTMTRSEIQFIFRIFISFSFILC